MLKKQVEQYRRGLDDDVLVQEQKEMRGNMKSPEFMYCSEALVAPFLDVVYVMIKDEFTVQGEAEVTECVTVSTIWL